MFNQKQSPKASGQSKYVNKHEFFIDTELTSTTRSILQA